MSATVISATRPATRHLAFPVGARGLEQAACGRSSPRCPVCGNRMEYWGTGDYYGPGTPMFPAPLSRCCSCKAIRRDLPSEVIASHCDAASYTNLKNEDRFHRARASSRSCTRWPKNAWQDQSPPASTSAPSYGHFLQILKGHGSDATGIEIVDTVRTSSQEKGLTVFKSLAELTEHKMNRNFDLIAMIDSLYYVDDPRHTLRSMRRVLAKDGVLLLRFANRNWITWFCEAFAERPITTTGLGMPRSPMARNPSNGCWPTAASRSFGGSTGNMEKRCQCLSGYCIAQHRW